MLKSLSKLLIVAGLVGIAGCAFWWYSFFSNVNQFFTGSTAPLPFPCLYTLGGQCGVVERGAALFGGNSYDPRLFWISSAAVVIGAIFDFIPDDEDRFDLRKKDIGRRDDPYL